MHFTNAIAAAVLATCALAAPAAEKRSCWTLRPEVTSQYSVWTGAVNHNVGSGLVSKPLYGSSTDITTLVTFRVPASAAGATCSVGFTLGSSSTSQLAGTARFDYFSSLAPADRDTSTWPSGNLRDQYGGRMQAVKPGSATWVEDITHPGSGFPCPADGLYGAELVGTGDYDLIAWDAATEGPVLNICN